MITEPNVPALAPTDEQVERMLATLAHRHRAPRKSRVRIAVIGAALVAVILGGSGATAFATRSVPQQAPELTQAEIDAYVEAGGSGDALYYGNQVGISPEDAQVRLDDQESMSGYCPQLGHAAGDRFVVVSLDHNAENTADFIHVIVTEGAPIVELEELADSIPHPVTIDYFGTVNSETVRASLHDAWPVLGDRYPSLRSYSYQPLDNTIHVDISGQEVPEGLVEDIARAVPSYLRILVQKGVSYSLTPGPVD